MDKASPNWLVPIAALLGATFAVVSAAPTQTRLLREVADAPNFGSTLLSTAFQVGIAAAAAIGGAGLSAGWSYQQLPLMGAAAMACGLAGTLILTWLDRRRVPASA